MNFLFRYQEDDIIRFDTFKNFLISEAFKPKKVDLVFGKTTDGEYAIFYDELTKKEYAAVIFNRGEIAFTNTDNLDVKVGDDIQTKSNAPFSVMNSVFYAVIQMLKKNPKKRVYFNGYSPGLKRVYTKLSQNKPFIKEITKLGYNITTKKDDIVLTKD